MGSSDFHDKPYSAGTLTKLRIFQLYVQEWLPVFVSSPTPRFPRIHLFDFFTGPGHDSKGVPGSPLRILEQVQLYQNQQLRGWNKVRITVHLFDADPLKIQCLKKKIAERGLDIPGVNLDIRTLDFQAALVECNSILCDTSAAKFLLIDQCGVDAVTDAVFKQLISFPVCDFIFFLSTSTLHRFRDHPAIKQKIAKPEDSYHVHRAAFDYYRGLLDPMSDFFLAPFSIKKRSNIYGLIFGTKHQLGLHKFLKVAWANDEIAGEADFDIGRENIEPGELLLELEEMRPRKIRAFEADLEVALRAGRLRSEAEIARFCMEAGMTCQKSKLVLQKLKAEGFLSCDFDVPDIKRFRKPRTLTIRGSL